MTILKRSVGHLRQLVSPPFTFTSGARIYEPDDVDLSPAVSLKRQLISAPLRTLEFGESLLAGARSDPVRAINESTYERIESILVEDTEKTDFVILAQAIDDVVEAARLGRQNGAQ